TVDRFDVDATGFENLAWRERRRVLGDWLLRLRRPAGVMAFSDVHGRMLTEAARDRGIEIPGEIAVISCERDDLTALVSVPALSSIESNAEEVGFAAARQLDLILRGGLIPSEIKFVPPKGVVARQSTDILAIDDAQLRHVCDFIRDNAYRPIGVEDVVEHVGMSRRSLERRLRGALGVSPSELIRRRRIETATRLIFDTDLSLTEIAIQSGFSSAQAMTRAFRAEYGRSPGEFRRDRMFEV
ncbi:MAG: helix-turn-helix domain-containing protein, partial [Phycisphaerales bacterium]|nr:helix-turn-helix domain-containing protein [Phycisphaerales bacterium]